jgi:hypothetical protein
MFRTAFLDLLLNVALTFACMFALAFVQMRPLAQAGNPVEPKAELIIEMSWPDGSLHDIDLWLLLPDGQRVGFNKKDVGQATLDRDDRGAHGDIYWDGTERRLIRSNREVIAVRGLAPGRYVVNAYYYAQMREDLVGFADEWRQDAIPVKVKLTRLNPRVTEVGTREVTLSRVGEQATAFGFEVDEEGHATLHADADLPFVEMRP